MLKDITLGQYFPGDTFVHRLDPRTKIITVIAFIVALFSAANPLSYLIVAAAVCIAIAVSGVKFRFVFKGLKPVLFLLIFTGIINIIFTPGRVLFSAGIITISEEGIIMAIKIAVRIILLIAGTSLLTYTTSPIMLTDAVESLFSPLKKLKFPAHELAMMMSIALRFIPTLIEETGKIMNAQKARGADFESGNLIKRAKALIPILVPLFISAFRRADEIAVAMECRLYHGGEGRTRLKELKFYGRDYAMLILSAAFAVGIILLRRI